MDLEDPIARESLVSLASSSFEKGRPLFYVLTSANTPNDLVKHAFTFENLNNWFDRLQTPTNPTNRQPLDILEVRMMAEDHGGDAAACDYSIGTCSFDRTKNEWVGPLAELVASCIEQPDNAMPLLYLAMLLQHGGTQYQQGEDAAPAARHIMVLLEQQWEREPTCQNDITSFVEHMIELSDQHMFRNVNTYSALCNKLEVSSLANARLPSGRTPLVLATKYGDADFVRLLLELDANPNDAYTANYASSSFDVPTLEDIALFEQDVSGTPPLSVVLCQQSSPQRDEIIEALLQAGAKIDAVNAIGVTPLFIFNYMMETGGPNVYSSTIIREIKECVKRIFGNDCASEQAR